MVGVVWHGVGIACLCGIFLLCRRLREQLRGAGWKPVCRTLGIGVISGIAGMLVGILLREGFDSFVRLDPVSDALLAARMLIITFFFILGALFVGFTAERLLHAFCLPGAVSGIALIISALLIMQPVAYGWITRAWSFLTNSS